MNTVLQFTPPIVKVRHRRVTKRKPSEEICINVLKNTSTDVEALDGYSQFLQIGLYWMGSGKPWRFLDSAGRVWPNRNGGRINVIDGSAEAMFHMMRG